MTIGDYLNKGRNIYKTLFNQTVINNGAFLLSVAIPTEQEILNYQKKIFKATRGVNETAIADPLLQQLNNDLIKPQNFLGYGQFEQNIKEIEQLVETLNQPNPTLMLDKAQEINQKKDEIDQLIKDYQLFYKNLANKKDLNSISYALKPIEQRLSALESYAQSLKSSIPAPSHDSFNRRITWCEYVLKGQYLESEGKEFLASKIPHSFVINTGSFYGSYDIAGNFVNRQMKEDIVIINNPNLQIEFTIGKNKQKQRMTIQEFTEYLETRETTQSISFTEYGYQQLQSGLIAAVQAKATRSNRLKFGNININTAIKDRQGLALIKLKEIYDNTKGGIYVSHEDYNLLFNYNLARNINYLLGNNTILLTRDGLTDLNNYIYYLMNKKHKYFYSTEKIHLAKNTANKIAIDQN